MTGVKLYGIVFSAFLHCTEYNDQSSNYILYSWEEKSLNEFGKSKLIHP